MVLADIPLTLIPFASDDVCAALHERLSKIGCKVKSLKPHRSKDIQIRSQEGVAVFLFDKPSVSKSRILSIFSNMAQLPRFGLFCRSEEEWDRDLLLGCSEFSSWPCSENELEVRLERMFRQHAVIVKDTKTTQPYDELLDLNMVGRSRVFLSSVERVRKFAACDAPVFIEGETGTGKELMARAIHYLSKRRDYPFVAVNCGAIPDNLVENELFGHDKGAFTDASRVYAGVIAQAEGGTLFLDEIDALCPKGQVSLLRFLQDSEYRPLGARHSKKANVRLVTACNRSLDSLVSDGRFRQDLHFRLNIMTVAIPPLRDRVGDAELLAEYFMDSFRRQYARPDKRLHASSMDYIRQYEWPGNVRELENLIHREFLLSDNVEILFEAVRAHDLSLMSDHLDSDNYLDCPFGEAKKHAIEGFEKQYLAELMSHFNGNITQAAKHAGKERRALGKLLKKYGFDRYRYRDQIR
jgi:DNA-binding NtrC family response regulator